MDKDAEDRANVERYEASRIGADATEAILKIQSDAGATVFRQAVEIARLKAALEAERALLDAAEERAAMLAETIEHADADHKTFCNGVHTDSGDCEGHYRLGVQLEEQRSASFAHRARRSAERAAQENGR